MTEIDMNLLQSQCAAAEDIFYTEARFFPEPLLLLHTLYGAGGYKFAFDRSFVTLKIVSTGMIYSVLAEGARQKTPAELVELALDQTVPAPVPTEAVKKRLARFALQALPPRRIADILFEKSDGRSGVFVAGPFALVPSTHRHKHLAPNAGKRGRGGATSDVEKLAAQCACDTENIEVVEESFNADNRTLRGFRINTPERTFEPMIYCETRELSMECSMLAAICHC